MPNQMCMILLVRKMSMNLSINVYKKHFIKRISVIKLARNIYIYNDKLLIIDYLFNGCTLVVLRCIKIQSKVKSNVSRAWLRQVCKE